jgi:hypothetical protein
LCTFLSLPSFSGAELAQSPPVFSRLLTLLREIRRRLRRLVPSQAGWAAAVNNEIDVDLTAQMIPNNAFGGDAIAALLTALHSRIRGVQAPAMDAEWDSFLVEMTTALADAATKWCELLPRAFNRILCQLDAIETAAAAARAQLRNEGIAVGGAGDNDDINED